MKGSALYERFLVCFVFIFFIAGFLMLIIAFLKSSPQTAVCLIFLCSTLSGAAIVRVIILDMAPYYASTLIGLIDTVVNILGYIVSSVLLARLTDEGLWLETYIISGLVGIFGTVIFCAFGSAEVQYWDRQIDQGE